MRRWYVPLTVLGLGSVGAFLLSERGRNALRLLWERFERSPDSLQTELDRIQAALDRIAHTIDPHPELGQ
jgi:hypothetical protein